jgi:hypothetical protein
MTWKTQTCRDVDSFYNLKSHEHYGFFTGESQDGGLLIIGTMCRKILRFVFDSEGRYRKTVTQELSSKIDPDLRQRFPDDECPELAKIMEDEQIIEREISVRRFFGGVVLLLHAWPPPV